MQLDRIKIEGYKSIRTLDLDLGPLNVLIGANGAGKSNFISLFSVLHEMVGERFQQATQIAGGEALLYLGAAETEEIRLELQFGANGYGCSWVPTATESLVFGSERCWYQGEGYDRPFQVDLGSGHRETRLREESQASPHRRVIADYVLKALGSWRLYHFHDTSLSARVRKTGPINDDLYLRSDARNLAAFLYRLRHRHVEHYDRIVETVRGVAPFFEDFILRPLSTDQDQIRMEWREVGRDYPFLAHQLSDGTLRFICLATLLLQPQLPAVILVDEPELGLHPQALSVLGGLIRSAARRTQVIVTTQSIRLIDEFEADELLVVERKTPERWQEAPPTTIRRLNADQLSGWLEDYSLSELWEKNVLGGRP